MAKIGYLPLYVKLYDDTAPAARPRIDAFSEEICQLLSAQGNQVVAADVCRLESEFQTAIDTFEKEKVDCIVTLHLAYSPSLESCYVLAKTKLPIIVLDTTPTYCFDYKTSGKEIMYNHGIHGVQDMCCMLRRLGKEYSIFAGHYTKSNVISQVSDAAKAIASANKIANGIKVGMIGKPFAGMGDFVVSNKVFKKFGITKVVCDEERLASLVSQVSEEQIKAEFENDKNLCDLGEVDYDYYKDTEKVALGVRKWVEENKINAFSINFQSVGEMKGLSKMPFTEASKSMAKGIGYAGEGDILTAGVCYAFLTNFEKTGFVEMFCPDWENDAIFMSHMGEFNLSLLEGKRMLKIAFPYAENADTTCIKGHAMGGKCCLINIAPNANDSFDMIFVDGEMLSVPEDIGELNYSMAGWFKPNTSINKLLAEYSKYGGTHHSIVVYGATAESLCNFASTLKLNYKVL